MGSVPSWIMLLTHSFAFKPSSHSHCHHCRCCSNLSTSSFLTSLWNKFTRSLWDSTSDRDSLWTLSELSIFCLLRTVTLELEVLNLILAVCHWSCSSEKKKKYYGHTFTLTWHKTSVIISADGMKSKISCKSSYMILNNNFITVRTYHTESHLHYRKHYMHLFHVVFIGMTVFFWITRHIK